MERQNRLITILAVVLLALVAIAVLGKDPPEQNEFDRHEPPDVDLFDFEAASITSLELTTANGEVVFAKTDGEWAMTAPKPLPVEARKVTEIVDRLASLEAQDRDLDGDAASYGLDEAARAVVTAATADGASFTLYVGMDSPVGYRTYVAKSADGPTLLASSRIHELAHRAPDDFRSRELWDISSGTARRIRIEEPLPAGAARVVVLRKDDHGWWLGDEGPRVSESEVTDWLSKADMLRADTFLDGQADGALGLDAPRATITVEDAAGTDTLRIGAGDASGVNVRGAGGPVRVGVDVLDLFHPGSWAETKLVPVRRYQLDAIEVELGDRSARFTKTDGAWTGADGQAADVDALLDAIEAATADREATAEAPGAPAWGRISLKEGTSRSAVVVIGAPTADGRRAAREEAGGPAFVVPQADLDAIAGALPK